MNVKLKVLVGVAILIFSGAARSQNHFLYIQADDQQRFSAALNQKTYNSGKTGHLLIPKLPDGPYTVVVKKDSAEYQFPVEIKGKDLGLRLKNVDGQWTLVDVKTKAVVATGLQGQISGIDSTVVPSADKNPATTTVASRGEPSGFARMLADVLADPSLLELRFEGGPQVKKEIAKNTKKKAEMNFVIT